MRTSRFVLMCLLALLMGVAANSYAQTAILYKPITPCRLLDTRSGQPLQGGVPLTFTVQGVCGIPAGVAAYSLNVTVVPHGTLNYLTVWPDGQTRPVVSTMNSYDGRIKANAAIVPSGSGKIDLYATDTTDVILDISGYFATSSDSPLAYYSVTPCRIADTRGGQYLHGQQTEDFGIQGVCGIPDSALAFSLNLTAIPRTRSLNYLTAWPKGESQPATSTLNAPTGTITANAAIVQSGLGGDISVFA
jgi:hypothetical protein